MNAPATELAADQTHGMVCAHHHLYSALARGMPAPPRTPTAFVEILEQVWWRLDRALDADTIEWSAKLGALEALEVGCTAIIDHHESPNAIEGSLSIIADACAEVGVRVSCAYGVTDRHGAEMTPSNCELDMSKAPDRSVRTSRVGTPLGPPGTSSRAWCSFVPYSPSRRNGSATPPLQRASMSSSM